MTKHSNIIVQFQFWLDLFSKIKSRSRNIVFKIFKTERIEAIMSINKLDLKNLWALSRSLTHVSGLRMAELVKWTDPRTQGGKLAIGEAIGL